MEKLIKDEDNLGKEKLELAPPMRLVGMTWAILLIIYFLPPTTWAVILKIILGLFLLVIIRGSFSAFWERYATMGAFVTMQTAWFVGLLWTPSHFNFIRYIFVVLIILGIFTKVRQIRHINKGYGPDLSKNNF